MEKNQSQAQLHLVRALYFIQCVAGCCVSNFLVVFLKDRGLDYHHIGIIFGGIFPFAQMLAQPAWCWLADVSEKPKLVIITSLVSGTAVIFSAHWFHTFLKIAIAVGLGTVLNAAVNPLLDSATISTLLQNGVSIDGYGRFRVFGALGWGLAAVIIGPMVDALGVVWLFYNYAIASAVFALLLCGLRMSVFSSPSSQDEEKPLLQEDAALSSANITVLSVNNHDQDTAHASQENGGTSGSNGKKAVSFAEFKNTFLFRPSVMLFFTLVAVMGISKGAIDAFLFAFLQDMGASNTLLGLTLAVTTVSEVPFFYFSGPLIKRLGAVSVVVLALLAYTVRLGYYSMLTSPWWVLPAELLHGVTFSLSWAAIASFAALHAPPGWKSTAQGIASATFFGLGFGIGALGGGYIIEAIGVRTYYQGAGCLNLVAAALGSLLRSTK